MPSIYLLLKSQRKGPIKDGANVSRQQRLAVERRVTHCSTFQILVDAASCGHVEYRYAVIQYRRR